MPAHTAAPGTTMLGLGEGPPARTAAAWAQSTVLPQCERSPVDAPAGFQCRVGANQASKTTVPGKQAQGSEACGAPVPSVGAACVLGV